ncbi:putative acetyltransferase [Cercospora beticola]|uniref:Putative acetyltransferase n=1 Tax=Cercospora beticola TaxID=122368 RepID=A0A2G5HN01_CERBT|nr:putative acetyltransferase [Cercospora beticola]PIA93910.1 putative acetyltransferase [Cercospora beticola]WPB02346.1 hypothetical protein RHO25_006980 [Cercospora beticola]CAK1362772.1 unnamed protein product [Cercospora beticola]
MAATQKNQAQLALAKQRNHVPWCEQYERMISGMLYDSFVPEMKKARFHARAWQHKYNHYFPTDVESADAQEKLEAQREQDLGQILGHIGKGAYIEPPFAFDYGCNISIGDRFYGAFRLTIIDCGLVTIGDRVMVGPGVSIFAATHETEVQSRRDDIEFAKPVTIGNDCWIGGHVVILPGVTIGDGCTIAAGSIVTKDIPAWSVAMGSPARVVRKVRALDPIHSQANGC